jgi:hypothetical protein
MATARVQIDFRLAHHEPLVIQAAEIHDEGREVRLVPDVHPDIAL